MPVTPLTVVTPFLFGKAPAHGDFVSRGLESLQEQAWDNWASSELEAVRDQIGDGFSEAHGHAPPMRFVSQSHNTTGSWSAGVVAPSIDSAGRQFVLVAGIDGLSPGIAAAMGFQLCQAVEGLVYRVLGEPLSADAALKALMDLAPDPVSATAAHLLSVRPEGSGVWWCLDFEGLVRSGSALPNGLLTQILTASLASAGDT